MANFRTNRMLHPYKGYSIVRTHTGGKWYYSAHPRMENETDWWEYGLNVKPGELYGRSLKEIKEAICNDVAKSTLA